MTLFPNCTHVTFTRPYLTIVYTLLPPRPWPVSIAGVPAWFTTENSARALDLGEGAFGPRATISREIKNYQNMGFGTMRQVFEKSKKDVHHMTGLRWLGWGFLISTSSPSQPDWRSKYPSMINRLLLGYLFNHGDMRQLNTWNKIITSSCRDDTKYSTLRPGVILTSLSNKGDGEDLVTNSGVCVSSQITIKEFMTMALHGTHGMGSEYDILIDMASL